MTMSDREAVALLPCPFCCGEGRLIRCLQGTAVLDTIAWKPACRCGLELRSQTSEAAAIAAWNRRALSPEVREGWRLVPVEPTPEMLRAMDAAFFTPGTGYVALAYSAMLAAAPPPSGGGR